MGLLGKVLGVITGGPLVADQLDDKAERMFARRVGAAAIIFASCFGLTMVILAVRCG